MNNKLQELRNAYVLAKQAGDTILMEKIAREGKELKERENVCRKCNKRLKINLYFCEVCEKMARHIFTIKTPDQAKLL